MAFKDLQGKKVLGGTLLGSVVFGKKDFQLSEVAVQQVKGQPFLLTGINGVKEGSQIVDYEFFLESIDDDIQLTIPADQFPVHFGI